MNEGEKAARRSYSVGRGLSDGRIVELVYSASSGKTAFALYERSAVQIVPEVETSSGDCLVPIPATNNLIKHKAILLPESPAPYGSVDNLVASIGGYMHRYVDLSDEFRRIATIYVLLTWVYDAFNELPYLRLRGDFGSGKTRALTVIGSVCYRPFFASGASTVSPIFHTLDAFAGTLVLDEADFRFSDEKSELVKVFNNGNVKGFPVLRTAITAKREFDPRAFNVFGPKIIAMRRSFEDQALESRFLTEEMGQRRLRTDIPINLPDDQAEHAAVLRNKLLMYRFENLAKIKIKKELVDPDLSPRLNQILVPILSLVENPDLRRSIRETAKSLETSLYSDRSSTMDAGVLEIAAECLSEGSRSSVPVSEISSIFQERHGMDYEKPITNRQIGGILRRRLHISTCKSHGVYVVPVGEREKVMVLCGRYGVNPESRTPASTTDTSS